MMDHWAMEAAGGCHGQTQDRGLGINTLRHEQNIWYFADDIFKSIFLHETFCIKVSLNVFFIFPLKVRCHWFRYSLGIKQARSHYLNQCWPAFMISDDITGSRCVSLSNLEKSMWYRCACLWTVAIWCILRTVHVTCNQFLFGFNSLYMKFQYRMRSFLPFW